MKLSIKLALILLLIFISIITLVVYTKIFNRKLNKSWSNKSSFKMFDPSSMLKTLLLVVVLGGLSICYMPNISGLFKHDGPPLPIDNNNKPPASESGNIIISIDIPLSSESSQSKVISFKEELDNYFAGAEDIVLVYESIDNYHIKIEQNEIKIKFDSDDQEKNQKIIEIIEILRKEMR